MKEIGHYSSTQLSSDYIFCSGLVGIDSKTGKIVRGISEQTKYAIKNIEYLLEEQGLKLTNIVKVTVYLTREDDYQEMNKVYSEILGNHKPARSTVVVVAIPKMSEEGSEEILIEIDVIAKK